jgi:hypothetical protein
MGDWRYSSTVLDLSTREVSGQLHTPASLPLRKELLIPIGEEAGWTTEPVWTLWRIEKSLALLGIEPEPSSL